MSEEAARAEGTSPAPVRSLSVALTSPIEELTDSCIGSTHRCGKLGSLRLDEGGQRCGHVVLPEKELPCAVKRSSRKWANPENRTE